MINKIIGCLVICALLVSCNKERTFHVKAMNPVTGEPYGGLRVVVLSSRTGWDGEKYKTEYSGELNNNGEAMINVKVKNNRTYSVECQKPPNTCYTKDIVLYLKDHNEQNPSFLFEYAECAYLKLKIENVNCGGPDDKMRFRYKYNYSKWEGWSTERTGCYFWESTSYFEVSAGWRIYEYEVERSGNMITHKDSIYLSPNQEYLFELNY
jgi:hypothetical protein